jgi:hypothetical protein
VKVAYLLVTTAWFAGADVVPVSQEKQAGPTGPPPVVSGGGGPVVGGGGPVVSSNVGGSCNGCGTGCGTGCAQDACCGQQSWGHQFRERLHGLFQRHNNDCCNPCGGAVYQQATAGCCQPAVTHGHHGSVGSGCCQTQICDDGCGNQGFGHKLFGRFRGMFGGHHNNNGCCDPCASGGYGGTGVYGAPIQYGAPPIGKKAEPLPPPMDNAKPLPNGKEEKKEEKKDQGAGINPSAPIAPNAPAQLAPPQIAPAQIAPPVAPALQPTPPAVPADNNKERSPF